MTCTTPLLFTWCIPHLQSVSTSKGSSKGGCSNKEGGLTNTISDACVSIVAGNSTAASKIQWEENPSISKLQINIPSKVKSLPSFVDDDVSELQEPNNGSNLFAPGPGCLWRSICVKEVLQRLASFVKNIKLKRATMDKLKEEEHGDRALRFGGDPFSSSSLALILWKLLMTSRTERLPPGL